LVHLSIQG